MLLKPMSFFITNIFFNNLQMMLLIQKGTIARPQVVNLSELQHVTILEFSQRRHFSYQKIIIIIIVNTLWLMYSVLTERQGKNQKEH